MNPFKYGTIVSGKDFCGRNELLKQLIGHIESSKRVAVLGERRIGKSSVVYEAVRKSKGVRLLYIDLLGIKTIDALCRRILRTIIVFEKKSGLFDKIIKTLSYLRPSISIDPVTSLPTVTFDTSIEFKANSIPEVFSLIETLSKKRKLTVVIDEFQDVLNLPDSNEALALLRSTIQFQGHIPFIYIGSIRHKMEEIFTHHDSPFFKSAVLLNIGPLSFKEFSKFIKKKLTAGQRMVDDEILHKIFEISYSIPGDIQQLCEAAWAVTVEHEKISNKKLVEALELIFSREQKSYENYISFLTDIQQKCLKAITLEGGKSVFSVSFLKSAGFNNPSTVRRAIKRLMNLNILYQVAGEYRFINPFFRAWLLHKG